MKDNFKNEFHFLRIYCLSIYKDEDREEGRAILRAIMRQEKDEVGLEDDSDLQGHMADYHFTAPELAFIEKGYVNSENFMLSFGLKFYNDEDCQEAKAIVRAFMTDDEEC